MQPEIKNDIGEEILFRLKVLISKLNKILNIKNEEEFTTPYMDRNRTQN